MVRAWHFLVSDSQWARVGRYMHTCIHSEINPRIEELHVRQLSADVVTCQYVRVIPSCGLGAYLAVYLEEEFRKIA